MKNYFEEILNLKGQEVEYEPSGAGHIKMVNHTFPFSIKEKEFSFLKDLIIRYNLKSGFETGTGFGISATAIGLGFKYTGGKLITLDSYIEEHLDSHRAYENISPELVYDTDGYKSTKFLIQHFNLEKNVFAEIGWSPDNIEEVLKKNSVSKIDFVFIDGGHFPQQVIKDILGLEPFMAEKFVVAFHDLNRFLYTPEVKEVIERVFKGTVKVAVPEPEGEDLSVIINK